MRALFLFSLVAAGAVGCAVSAQLDESSSDLVGENGPSPLDAVGAITFEQDGVTNVLCTGTLIAPRVVLTSKRCAELRTGSAPDGGSVAFEHPVYSTSIGALAFVTGQRLEQATHKVAVEGVDACRTPDVGGTSDYGCNLAVFHLAEDIPGIDKLAISKSPLVAGARYEITGYGDGVRRGGTMTLEALEGMPGGNTTALLPGHEAWFTTAAGDVRIAFNDMGAPAVVKEADGQLAIVAVAAGPTCANTSCPGGAFAVLGSAEQAFIDSQRADPCGTDNRLGRCEGDVAVRCSGPAEWPRRITKNDCGQISLSCVPPHDGHQVSCE